MTQRGDPGVEARAEEAQRPEGESGAAAGGESKPKLSTKERMALRAKVTEAYVPPPPPPPKPELSATQLMLQDLNQMRWKNHAKQMEGVVVRYNELQRDLYRELTSGRAAIAPNQFAAYYTRRCYEALKPGMTREQLLALQQDGFYAHEWRELVDCFMLKKKFDSYCESGNLDAWEDFEQKFERELLGIAAREPVEGEQRLRKPPKERAMPAVKPVEVRLPKQIAFREEEVIDRASLLTRAADLNLEVFDETKEPLVIIFIGHVDSGKSTIAGSILVNAGKIGELDLARLKEEAKQKNRENWYMAYLMDCFEEEKERGKTVEMGRAEFALAKKRFTLFDCPGHRNYVQNMMTGAAQADVAGLVISAKEGEFEAGFERDGQTREHAMLARAVGVTRLVVVVNKMDTVGWAQTRFEHIKAKLTEFLVQGCGFVPQHIYWCAISGLLNVFVSSAPEPSPASWFDGQSLFDTLDSLPPVERSRNNFLRVPLLDRQRDEGDLCLFGKVESGTLRAGMQCVLMPQMKTFSVTSVQSVESTRMYFANAGESVKVQVKGLEEDEIRRGMVVCGTQFWPHVCVEFEAEIALFQLQASQTITAGFECTLHLHTLMEEASISKVVSRIERAGASVSSAPAHLLKSGETGVVRIKVRLPICVEKFTDVPQMGRLVLRKESYTLAAGSITRVRLINKETLKGNCFFLSEAAPSAQTATESATA